ncbi:MAG: VCBS repeat-containing protein [Betaproteobacteria bacterium]|nr:MAG: VCBS repeat-containing protein [Betaproteobacteria bacterium]
MMQRCVYDSATGRSVSRLLRQKLIFCFSVVAMACQAQTATVVEYYNRTLDSYFLTGRPSEQAALDGVADFVRTGMTFRAFSASSAPPDATRICRYYISQTAPFVSSHFYGDEGGDCAAIAAANLPTFSNEGLDFAIAKAVAGESCPVTAPFTIYRAFRPQNTAAPKKSPNHQYSASFSSYNAMVSAGWSGEGPQFCATSATAVSITQAAGTDIKSWLTTDVTARLSIAGSWFAGVASAGVIGPYWNVVRTGVSQREGISLGGWGFNGWPPTRTNDVSPIKAALFEQGENGLLSDGAVKLGNPQTRGAGSVIVADFNGDRRDDLVMLAHNESPFLWQPSTAWMSRADGGFDRIELPDNVMAHDARLIRWLDGKPRILARSFGGSGNNGQGAGFHLLYEWKGSNFTVDRSLGNLGGMSIAAFGTKADATNWLFVGGSNGGGPGQPQWAASNPMLNYAYRYANGTLLSPPIALPKPYFNDKAAYAGFKSEWDPASKSHTSRLWVSDLNQDGLPDVLAAQEIWSGANGLAKSKFQLMLNRGGGSFSDDTDSLAPEYSEDAYIDYSVRLVDVDGSGIDTMFLSSNSVFRETEDATRQGQYVLVNDGTGRLYVAMRDEFRAMRAQIGAYINRQLPAVGSGTSVTVTQQFIAYRTAAGTLNFAAVARYFTPAQTSAGEYRFVVVNVPLQINLATDFRRPISIPSRNGSRRIRTFAGNDVIYRAVTDPDCLVDGGLGNNKVVYPGKRADWSVVREDGLLRIRPTAGPGGTDTLLRVQSAQFDDVTVDLTKL